MLQYELQVNLYLCKDRDSKNGSRIFVKCLPNDVAKDAIANQIDLKMWSVSLSADWLTNIRV